MPRSISCVLRQWRLELEAELLSLLAECHCRAGQPEKAIDLAREAVALAQRRNHRFAECHALIVDSLALNLLDDKGEYSEAGMALLNRCERPMAETGAERFRALADHARSAWEQGLGGRRHPLAQRRAVRCKRLG